METHRSDFYRDNYLLFLYMGKTVKLSNAKCQKKKTWKCISRFHNTIVLPARDEHHLYSPRYVDRKRSSTVVRESFPAVIRIVSGSVQCHKRGSIHIIHTTFVKNTQQKYLYIHKNSKRKKKNKKNESKHKVHAPQCIICTQLIMHWISQNDYSHERPWLMMVLKMSEEKTDHFEL